MAANTPAPDSPRPGTPRPQRQPDGPLDPAPAARSGATPEVRGDTARAAPVVVPGGITVPGNAWHLLDGRTPPEPPEVTVVVPYYNQQRQLDLLLAALALQTHPSARLQIVVADDGSTLAPSVPGDVLVVQQADRGFRAAAARNLGARAADGSVLCFLDADTIPTPGYVTAASRLPALCADAWVVGRRRHADLRALRPDQVPGWCRGEVRVPLLADPSWLAEGYAASHQLRDVDDRSYRFVISAVLTTSAALFAELGGFDEQFTSYGGEDWDLAHRAFCAGAVFAHEPAALAWHDGPDQAGRGMDRAAKNKETWALTTAIPDPHMRAGWWGSNPEIVVEIAHGQPDALLVCARSALAGGDVEVWLPTPGAAAGDPRLHTGAVPPAVAARARVRVRCDRPVRFGPGELAALARRVTAPGPGRLVGPGITVTASRAERRASRHGVPVPALFAVETCAGPDLLDPVPDLAEELARLARG